MIKKDFTNKIQEFKNKSSEEKLNFLSKFWGIDIQQMPFKLIGTYEKADKTDKNGKEYGFFVNVRNMNGDILYYPFNLGQVRIWIEHRDNLSKQDFWLFDVELSKKPDKNPFQLNLANKTLGIPKDKFMDKVAKENFIRKIFHETGATPRDAKNLANALKNVTGDLYTETERFIFELLQNADDIPNERGEVDVKFALLRENLLFLHNGKPFDNNDVESISSIGDSTKRKDTEKTGYKGIGFKSVFTDAETVLINSGNFSFSFDKSSPLYDELVIEEIPWEIKPIWTEVYRYPREVKENEDFFKYPVAIDLEVGNAKIHSYKTQISNLFSEPRFILFLRNVKSIEVQGIDNAIKIQKKKNEGKFDLLNNGVSINSWIIDDFDFLVSREIRDTMSNDKLVPPKLKEIQKSKLSFACQIKDNRIISILPEQSYLFTYLPTNVNDYKFPFLVNADFLTTANRQTIHVKNSWNLYLFEQIGYLSFLWIAQISQKEEIRNSITNLIPTRHENENEQIHSYFNRGFDKAISEVAFLPTYKQDLSKVSDAIVDITGFSDVIGDKLFNETLCANKNLIINELINKENLSNLKDITIFGKEELKKVFSNYNFGMLIGIEELLQIFKRNKELNIDSCDIRDIIENVSIETLNNWIENCEQAIYEVFLQELEESYLRKKTKERILQIKLFKFSDSSFYSFEDIIEKYRNCPSHWYGTWVTYAYRYTHNIIVNSHKIQNINNELKKLDFIISDKIISKYKYIFSAVQLPEDKSLYDLIADKCKMSTLCALEKKNLFLNFTNEQTKFSDVGETILKDLCLFADKEGQVKPLKELISSELNTPEWLQSWVIKSDEYFPELKRYLISEAEIYPTVILQYWDTLITKATDIKNLYEKTIYYYGLKDANTSLKKNVKYVYTKDGFKQANQVFFNSKMVDLDSQFVNFQNAILSLFGLTTPNKAIIKYLTQEPFKVDSNKLIGHKINNATLDINEIKAIITFCKLNGEQFFKHYIIQKKDSTFSVFEKSVDKFQISSPDKHARDFIDKYCSEKLFVLPYELIENKDEDGIIKTDDLHSKILECVAIDEHKETLIDIVKYKAKSQFLQNLSEIRLSSETEYTKESYEYKILDLACAEIKNEQDLSVFRKKVVIETPDEQLKLTDIHSADKIEIGGYELKLSKILPANYRHSHIISYLLKHFSDLELPDDKLNRLFNIDTAPTISQLYQLFLQQQVELQNDHQIAFLSLYLKNNSERNFNFSRYQLTAEQKKYLFDCMFKTDIKGIKWIEVEQSISQSVFGFKPETSVYPSKYACESEQLPKYLIEWVGNDEQKIKFLADWKVWTEGSTIVELRKFWNNEGDFESNQLEREIRFDISKINLANCFEWLQSNHIELKTKEQYDVFKQTKELKNRNCYSSNCYHIEEPYDFAIIKQQVKEWDYSNYKNWKKQLDNKFTVYLYDGELPKITRIRGRFDNYIFYRFKEGNFAIDDENNIYVNETVDIFDSLLALSSENKKKLSSDDLLPLIAAKSDAQLELENRIKQLESQLAVKDSAYIDLGGFSNDLPNQEQRDWNLEARKIVKEELEKEGYQFTQEIGEYGIIDGVFKNGTEYPLVVLSAKGGTLFINPNEWLQLCKPNSLLLGIVSDRKIRSFTLKSLLGIEQEFNLRFKVDNLKDKNFAEFAKIFHYFSGVHLKMPIDNNIGTVERFESFFGDAKPETDINDNDSDSML